MILGTDKQKVLMKRAAFKHLVEHGIEDEHQLWFVIREMFGVTIPRETCCPEHQPFWDGVVDDFFHRTQNQAYRHCRGGGKTFQVATGKSAKLLFCPGIRMSNFAATEQQGYAFFNYIQKHLGPSADPEIQKLIDGQIMSSTAKTLPRPAPGREKAEGSVMRVLVGTLKGVNSAHVDDLVIDERAQMADEVYKESIGMMTAAPPYPGVQTVLSTVKTKGDGMDKLLEDAEDLGFKTYVSCILDVMTCQEKTCDRCKNTCAKSDDGKETKSFYEFCQGRLQGRTLGHFSVPTALRKFTGMGLTNAVAQLFCRAPEGEQRAFPMFSREKHILTELQLITLRPLLRGIKPFIFGDFGKSDNSAWLKAWSVVLNGIDCIVIDDELIGNGRTIQQWIPELREAGFGDAAAFLVDVAGRQTTITDKKSAIEYMEDEEWNVVSEKMNEVETTDRVRELLRRDPTQILVGPKCKKLIEALERSENKSVGTGDDKTYLKVVKHNKFSHPIDALRYGVNLLLGDDHEVVADTYKIGR